MRNLKITLGAALLALAVVGLSGCARGIGGPGDQPPPGESIRSDLQRVAFPETTNADLEELVAGNSRFALDLYQEVAEPEENLFFSPYSISLALGMTYAGARGETERQMADTLHFTLRQEDLHPALNALDLQLARRGEGAEGKDEEGFRLNIANAIWGQAGYSFLPQFLDMLAENYGAGLNLLDFVRESEQSRGIINDWVSDATEGKIEDLLPAGSINPASVLVLTNAIYFNAAWNYPFETELTRDGAFHLLDGDQVEVPMMEQTEFHGYGEGEAYQAVELLYDGEELSMIILLPESGRFEEFAGTMDADGIASILDSMNPQEIHLRMPKFTYESGFKLKDNLVAMGMPAAFTSADFSGIDGTHSLFIDDVYHKAFVSVDEAGTEAAAATAVVVARAAPTPPKDVTVDRPFIFLIRDIETGAILFLGQVMDPSV